MAYIIRVQRRPTRKLVGISVQVDGSGKRQRVADALGPSYILCRRLGMRLTVGCATYLKVQAQHTRRVQDAYPVMGLD